MQHANIQSIQSTIQTAIGIRGTDITPTSFTSIAAFVTYPLATIVDYGTIIGEKVEASHQINDFAPS